MPQAWEAICEGNPDWKTRVYKTRSVEDYQRRAGVITFDDRVTLSVDEKLLTNAERGCKLSNFILAHEVGHLALDHHAEQAVIKNFQLFSGSTGLANIPPTLEEYEANFAAIVFQCGAALLQEGISALDLANRAYSDVRWVKKVQLMVQSEAFKKELQKPNESLGRVVL
ncbi:MAG: M48 family metalloprotease [Pseudomonadota bacterium]